MEGEEVWGGGERGGRRRDTSFQGLPGIESLPHWTDNEPNNYISSLKIVRQS
jgi:hypothetical protein